MAFRTDLKPVIAAALSRVSLAEVFQQHGLALRKTGEDYVACCPFHSEKTPSCHIYTKQNRYHCFGCGARGDTLTFLMESGGKSFLDAVASLAAMAGVPLPDRFSVTKGSGGEEWQASVPGVFGLRKPAAGRKSAERKFREPRKTWEAPPAPDSLEVEQCAAIVREAAGIYRQGCSSPLAQAYLKERHITAASAERFCLGYADGSSPVCREMRRKDGDEPLYEKAGVIARKGPDKDWADRFRNRLIFPIRDAEGQYCGMGGRYIAPPAKGFGKADVRPKYINTPETPAYHKSRMLYGLCENQSAIRSAGKAILVEGYMDVIGLVQAGIENAVASCGTALTDAQLVLLLGYTSEILLCFDGDEAGRVAALKAAEKSLEYLRDGVTIRVLYLPDGQDPHDLMQAPGGVETFDRLALHAVPVLDVLMRHLLERFPVIDADSADRFMEEFSYYLSRVPGESVRDAWKGSAATVIAPYRPVVAAPTLQAQMATVSVNGQSKPQATRPMLPARQPPARLSPRMSDAFAERAIWWLFHLPWENVATIWEDIPVSWMAYAQSAAQSAGVTLEHLARALNALSRDPLALADAQTTAIRAILKKVDGQKDFMDAVRRMDLDAQKAEVSAIARKIAVHVTRCRLAYVAGVAERDGIGALTDEERLFLSSAGRSTLGAGAADRSANG